VLSLLQKEIPESFNKNPSKHRLFAVGPFFELFLKKAGPEGLSRKTFKIETQ
jgi:hypothetical protein